MKKDLIKEARCYVEKAQQFLEENGKLDEEINHYENKQSVRKAGRILWHGVLLAIDAVFDVRPDRRTKVNIDDYVNTIIERDKSLSVLVDNSYSIINVYMAYDGFQSKPICDDGFELANDIIDRCAVMAAS